VENPLVLNFKQILQDFDQFTLPVTLVCAGNRRKEQNQVRKSKGFSWGPAGVSTALFTGPLMSEVIWKAKPFRRAKYVCMEGADKLVRRPDNDFIYDLLTICSPTDSMGHQSS
jgi:nitrate reductase (NAD(P)H)